MSYLFERYRSVMLHQIGEHTTHPIARFASCLALLLRLKWNDHAALSLQGASAHAARTPSYTLAMQPAKRTLGFVQSPFLGLILCLVLTIGWKSANAVEATLSVTMDGKLQRYSADTLRSRSDVVTITVKNDPSYRRPMTYRAIPLAAIFEGSGKNESLFLEAKALDGFVSELPGALALNRDASKAVAMLAIEDPAAPWPPLPGKSVSAGPFYLVWIGSNVTAIRSEQWPYQLASLAEEEAPEKRWPQLAVGPSLSKSDPRRQGQHLFIIQCLVCHKLDGGGNSEVGPDLNRPMNPTEYFTLPALKKFLRDPASVRNWPERKMPSFGTDALSNADIDRIIQYLQYKAANRQ